MFRSLSRYVFLHGKPSGGGVWAKPYCLFSTRCIEDPRWPKEAHRIHGPLFLKRIQRALFLRTNHRLFLFLCSSLLFLSPPLHLHPFLFMSYYLRKSAGCFLSCCSGPPDFDDINTIHDCTLRLMLDMRISTTLTLPQP